MLISIQGKGVVFEKESKIFKVDGRKVPFTTEYTLFNDKTNGAMKFEFSHSTGSEWDPSTVWVYKSDNGYELHVSNEDVTPQHAENYLKAKTRY